MMSSDAAPRRAQPAANAVVTVMQLTWKRFLRGRSLWLTAGISALLFLLLLPSHLRIKPLLDTLGVVIGILTSINLAGAVAEERDDKTSAYLWSRPIPRWSVVVGKYLVLAPATGLSLASAAVAVARVAGLDVRAVSLFLAVFAGVLAAGGLATIGGLFRFGMAVSLGMLVVASPFLSALGGNIRLLSITHHVYAAADGHLGAVVALLGIAGAAVAIAGMLIGRLE